MLKITLACPSNRGIRPKTAEALLRLVAHGGYEFHCIVPEHGYTIAENRNYIAVQALNNNSDYLLMCDDDMTFPPNLLDVLIADKKEIMGVAYHPRSETGQIIKYLDETHTVKLEQSTDPKYKKTFQCYATGTGIILIKCEVFKKIDRPWFEFEWYPTGQCKQGEDWIFCIKAGKENIQTWANPTIKVGHIGEVIL